MRWGPGLVRRLAQLLRDNASGEDPSVENRSVEIAINRAVAFNTEPGTIALKRAVDETRRPPEES